MFETTVAHFNIRSVVFLSFLIENLACPLHPELIITIFWLNFFHVSMHLYFSLLLILLPQSLLSSSSTLISIFSDEHSHLVLLQAHSY